jgi:8-oxo-dGTP pyrophosphatase MutT (NUDIX family)
MAACSDAVINRPIPPEFTAYVVANPIVVPLVLGEAAPPEAAPPAPAIVAAVAAAPVRRAGIIIYNSDNDTYLMGKNGIFAISNQYDPLGPPPRPPPRTVGQFIDSFPTISRINMIDYCKARLTANPIDRIANYQTLCATPIMQINPVFDFVKNYLINDFILNRNGIEGRHIVNNKTSVRIYQNAGRWSFPKGGFSHVDGLIPGQQLNLLQTALREFREEIGFDLATIHNVNLAENPIPVGQNVNFNTLYNIGISQYGNYKTYYMCVNAATAALIMAAVPAHQNNSELFDIRFRPYLVPLEHLQQDSNPMKNLIPVGFVCGQVYPPIAYVPPHRRGQQQPPAPPAPLPASGRGTFNRGPDGRGQQQPPQEVRVFRRGGSIYLHKLQKYQNKLNKN